MYISKIALNVNRLNASIKIHKQAERIQKQDIYNVMKENNQQPRLLYPARNSFKYEGEIKRFTDKQKFRELSTTKTALQQMLKDTL